MTDPYTQISRCAFRYNWLLVKPLVLFVLDSVLQDFDAENKVEVELNMYCKSATQS